MNRERAKELLPIITAFAEGKAIQARIPGNDGGWTTSDWTDADAPDFIEVAEYRIKPESREFWVYAGPGRYIIEPDGPRRDRNDQWIKVREVIE